VREHDERPAAGPGPWQVIGLPGVMRVATYLTTDHAPMYRLVVDVMLDHQAQYLSGIQHDQLATLIRERLTEHLDGDTVTIEQTLAPESFNLDSRLAQLAGWGVIHAWEDKVRSDEDFIRHRGRYQLSEDAARLHRAVRDLGVHNSSSIAATLAPPVIAEQLRTMRSVLETDPGAAAAAWGIITPTMQNMSDAATGWQARLASALSGSPDAAKISTLNETLSSYVSMWGAGIDIHSADISRDARVLLEAPESALRHVALHIAGAEAAEDLVVQVVAEVTAVLRRVLAWFDGPTSQAGSLRRQMRDTIVPMVRGKRALAAVGGHVSRRNELLNLAERLDSAADDDDAWDVWSTYTGLFSARHLALGAPHPGIGADALSFWDAPPTPVEARLRRQGPRSGRGRPSRMYDRTAGKEAARRAAAHAAREAAHTWEALLALSGRPLSQWTGLTEQVAEHLTDFVMTLDAAARTASNNTDSGTGNLGDLGDGNAGVVRATTGNGMWELTATLPAPGTRDAIVELPTGRLVYTDITVTVSRSADAPTLTVTADAGTPTNPADPTDPAARVVPADDITSSGGAR
jgi:uncharacterized protein (TIGR02677 family)